MKYCIAILSLFFSLNASAEYNFSHIEGSFIDSESKVDSRTFDGDGFGLSLSYEVGAQFVLFGGLSNFEMEATEDDARYTIEQDLNAIGIGRYFNLAEQTKLYFYFSTVDVDQTNRVSENNSTQKRSIPVDITRGQRIGASFIYDASLPIDVLLNVQYEDFGTFEETGYGISAYYNVLEKVNFGMGYSTVADTENTFIAINVELK